MKTKMKERDFRVFVSLLCPALVLTLCLVSPAAAIEGDLTGDGNVNFKDIAVVASNWLESEPPPPTQLPVYRVNISGLTPAQAISLSGQLGLSPSDIHEANGVGSYMDPNNFQALPMDEITDSSLINQLIYDSNDNADPNLFEGFDFDGINGITPYPDNDALSTVGDALDNAGLASMFANQEPEPGIVNTQFNAYDDVNDLPVVEDVNIDTQVVYDFSLDGIPLIGPGAQVSVSFDSYGNATEVLYSQRELETGRNVTLITETQAVEKFEQIFPELVVQPNDIELVYYAPPLSASDVGAIIPYYDCGGEAVIDGGETVLLRALVPATNDPGFVPSVTLDMEVVDGNTINALANATGGTGPHTFAWYSSTTDLSNEHGSAVNYAIVHPDPNDPNETVDSETLCVIVTDANGVEAWACDTKDINSPVQITCSIDVLGRTWADFGTERGISGRMGASNQRAFDYRMRLGGGRRRFFREGWWAWERHFKDFQCRPTGRDQVYVDGVDLTFYIGHGAPGYFTFSRTDRDDKWLTTGDAARCGCWPWQCPPMRCRGGWGNQDLEWLAMLSCKVLHKYWWERYPRRWARSFNGLHLLLGFHTVAYDTNGFGWTFADQMLGQWWRRPQPVRAAWFRAMQKYQPRPGGRIVRVRAAVMGVYGPRRVNNYNDYLWGCGRVGPDIRPPNIRGYWWVSQVKR